MERFVIGMSEDTEAEYGFRSDKPVTLLSAYDDEFYCVEGFSTLEAAFNDLKANNIESSQIEAL